MKRKSEKSKRACSSIRDFRVVRSGRSRGGMEVCNKASESNVACDLLFSVIDHGKSAQ